jgi:hypothetical protein
VLPKKKKKHKWNYVIYWDMDWMKLDTILLSEVSKSYKTSVTHFLSFVAVREKQKQKYTKKGGTPNEVEGKGERRGWRK